MPMYVPDHAKPDPALSGRLILDTLTSYLKPRRLPYLVG